MADRSFQPEEIKRDNEQVILAAGGRINPGLPILEITEIRSREDVVGRALVMNALLNLAFNAPVPVIARWIAVHQLEAHLTSEESRLLTKKSGSLPKSEQASLLWYIDGLWALLWVGSLIDDISFDQPVADDMATRTPNLQRNEGVDKFTLHMILRSREELFRMLDLYYRVSWSVQDARVNGASVGTLNPGSIMARRKSLEWVSDRTLNWDDLELSS